MEIPYLIFSDKKGNVYQHPFLRMAGALLDKFFVPQPGELIGMPEGSTMFYLPGRLPVGFNPETGGFEVLDCFDGQEVFSVGAFLVPAYLRLYNPAFANKTNERLPLWAYTACGFRNGRVYASAVRVDKRVRQSPRFYNDYEVKKKAKYFIRKYTKNRLYRHLGNCAVNYNCLAAKNLFLGRWEAPLPVSRFCNARCLGCLSYQNSACVSSHKRIQFKPGVNEIVEVMVNHFKTAKEAIVSFGQGCEGEPLLEADLIAESVRRLREKTARGTINMNTNASMPGKIEMLSKAGVDSFRVSINSPQEKFYNLYFKPKNYKFSDVIRSIKKAKEYGKFVSINLFVFPGFSDSIEQIDRLIEFIKKTKIDMIQLRNLNIDPDYYLKRILHSRLNPRGVSCLLESVRKEFPSLKTGYFNISKEYF